VSAAFERSYQRALHAAGNPERGSGAQKRVAVSHAIAGSKVKHGLLDRVRHLLDDEEIHLRNSVTMRDAEDLPASVLGPFIKELDRKARDPGTHRVLQQRAELAIRILREGIEKQKARAPEDFEAKAAEYAKTGRGTFGARFYVSARDAGRTVLLAGPFKKHADALAAVDKYKKRAHDVDPKAHWYSYGTVAMPRSFKETGKLSPEMKI
jgi:hypothetical protein